MMAISVFDLTEYTQLAIRWDTGVHPDDYSLGIHIHMGPLYIEEVQDYQTKGLPVPPEFDCVDAVDWETAVRMARWILDTDERIGNIKEQLKQQSLDSEEKKMRLGDKIQ